MAVSHIRASRGYNNHERSRSEGRVLGSKESNLDDTARSSDSEREPEGSAEESYMRRHSQPGQHAYKVPVRLRRGEFLNICLFPFISPYNIHFLDM